jgi:4-hydroxybenzoate polyprenyltransferase
LTGLFCLLVFQLDYFLIVFLYIGLNILYSFKLQRLPGINAGSVAVGFVLRVFAGAVIIDVAVSGWLVGLTFLLATFLTVSKRRCETARVAAVVDKRLFFDPGVMALALAVLVGYLAYTLSPPVIREHKAPHLYLTSVWVALGLLRYLAVGFNRTGDCSPVSVFVTDRPLQVCVILWIVTLWGVIYLPGS